MRSYLYISIPLLICLSCYSMKNVSLSPEVQTFNVENFELRAGNAPATLDQLFTERLKDKIRSESRLNLVNEDADLVYRGEIVGFEVSSVAPQPGETTAFNRLRIRIKVEFENYVEEDKDWTETFSFFSDFDTDQVLTDVQDQLIEEIFDQITEDVFNRSFSDW